MNRNLDGVYFRIKRGNKFENVCFSDLTPEERDDICRPRTKEWMQKMLYIMADTIVEIGEEFDIVRE